MAWNRFLQDQIWVDKNRHVHNVATMDPYHRKRVINFLRRRADVFALGEYFRLAMEFPKDPSDGIFWAFEEMLAKLDDGSVWMENTPLMKALLAADQEFENNLSRWERLRRWFLDLPVVEPPRPSIYER
jgi:hypothetical protein